MSRSKDQDFLDKLAGRLRAEQAGSEPKPQTNGHASVASLAAPPYIGSAASEAATDEAIIEKCRGAENAAKFEALFDRGDVHAHHGGDDSAADLGLLGILAFWTQDEAQLERLVSSSALGRREKWRRRDDYRERTVRKALAELGETYDWGRQGSRPLASSSSLPLGCTGDDDTSEGEDVARIVWFAELGEPKEREYLIEKIGVKGYPIVAFGAGGVAKSFAMLAGGIAIASASGVERWLGFRVLDHGHVFYLDFEIDAVEMLLCVSDL